MPRTNKNLSSGTCGILSSQDQPARWNEILFTLYYPLIQKDAVLLYQVLQAYEKQSMPLESLIQASLLSAERFTSARKVLEQFLLLQTYYDALKQEYLFIIRPVMEAGQFLSNVTYSRLFMNERGSEAYSLMKARWLKETEIPEGMEDISADFDTTRLERTWDAKKERTYERLKPRYASGNRQALDFDRIFGLNGRIFPGYKDHPEILEKISDLAMVYGTGESQLRHYASRCWNPRTQAFNVDLMASLIQRSSVQRTQAADPYALSPIQFLYEKQNGATISQADRRLIEDLCSGYNFPLDVVNILIEHVLNSTGQRLNRSYVEKVASAWARLQVDSREKAFQAISNQAPAKKSSKDVSALPEWYAQTKEETADIGLLEQIEALRQKQSEGRSS